MTTVKTAALKSAHPSEMRLHKDLEFTPSISCCFPPQISPSPEISGEGGDRSGMDDKKSRRHISEAPIFSRKISKKWISPLNDDSKNFPL
ncbi:hypothetical protein CDAR_180091 [Caerostris darwini]|uniref:Uncharacterized protein n=1 Tax=Caerostris darwini TaxID=1538125 RepID=A0AAV4TXA3_9ARAC|nr:hypothetical protein CDAR_180091 [Caerostris darwini]